jgi:hypothetical protein
VNQPNFTQVDERLRAVLLNAMQRDPKVLSNADHLHALLADLAPDMPVGLRSACVAVARTNATSWLTQTPPYSEEQVVAWLRSQYPDLTVDNAHQAVAAFAQLTGARPGPGTPAAPAAAAAAATGAAAAPPVFDQPTVAGSVAGAAAAPPSFPPAAPQPVSQPAAASPVFTPPPSQPAVQQPVAQQPLAQPGPFQPAGTDRPPVSAMQTEMPMHPSFPPGAWPPSAPPPPPPAKSRGKKLPIIAAIVAVLLIGGGLGAFFLLKGGDDKGLAAPQQVTAKPDSFGSVAVSWKPVPGADHYKITDLTGNVPNEVVEQGTSYVFEGAATKDHRFVVQAVDKDGSAGAKSEPEVWAKRVAAPTTFQATAADFDLQLTWSKVAGASGYQLRDEDDPSFTPETITGTSYTVKNAIYSTHHFTVAALSDGDAGAATTATYTPLHELTADQAALAYKLTTDLVDPTSCKGDSADEENVYVSAAVSCIPTDPGGSGPPILYASQLTSGDQNNYEQDHFGRMQSKVGCEDSFPASGTHATWQLSGTTIGDEYCFQASNLTNVFAWTYYDENIVIQIEGKYPATRSGMHEWWGNHVTLLRSGP